MAKLSSKNRRNFSFTKKKSLEGSTPGNGQLVITEFECNLIFFQNIHEEEEISEKVVEMPEGQVSFEEPPFLHGLWIF